MSHASHPHHHHGAGGHAHGHGGHVHGHGSANKRRVLIAAALTAGFMVVEAIGGILVGSLALLADAGHMLTDSVALILAWYAFHLGTRAATSRMTYGFDRVKILVAYSNGLAIFAIGVLILIEAWQRIQEPQPVLGGAMFLVALAGLAINLAALWVLHGGDRENLNMRGALLHVLGDLLGSVGALVASVVIMLTGWSPIDPILSVLVCVILFRSAWMLVRESGHLLLEGVPASVDRNKVARDLEGHVEGLREVHHMHVWSMDGSRNMATLHACLHPGADAEAVVRAVKQRLATRHEIGHATVETERETCADARPGDHAAHSH